MSLRVCAPGLDLARLDDGAGADGVVGRLVDQDERAAVPVVGVGVGDHDRAGAQRHRPDVVERQLDRVVELVERLGIQPGVQRLHRRAHRLGGLLERDPVTGAQRGLGEPAHRRVEFAGQHRQRGVVGAADEHVAAADVDVVGQFDRHRQRRNGSRAVVVEGVDGGDGATGCPRAATRSGRRRSACRPTVGRCSGAAPRRSAATPTGREVAASVGSGCGRDSSTPSRYSSSVGPVYQGVLSERCTTLSPCLAAIGMTVSSAPPRRAAICCSSACDLVEPVLVEVDQVDLVDRGARSA